MTNDGQRSDPLRFQIENEMDLLLGRAHPNPTREGCPPRDLLVSTLTPRAADRRSRLRALLEVLAVLSGAPRASAGGRRGAEGGGEAQAAGIRRRSGARAGGLRDPGSRSGEPATRIA